MRINNLKTDGFGKFTSKELSGFENINIFYGENEAGKSTIFKMIKSLIFGFDKKKDKLLINKENNTLNIRGDMSLSNNNVFIERNYGDDDLIIEGNKTVDHIEGLNVSKEIYSKLYSLDLDILLDINKDTWEDIEELLTRQYSGDIYNTPKHVLANIDNDLNKIKRGSNRGRSKLKSLENERLHKKKEKREAILSLDKIDELFDEINRIEGEINRLIAEKNNILNEISFIEKYKPISDLYKKKSALEDSNYNDYIHITEEKYQALKEKKKDLYKNSEILTSEVNSYISRKRELEKNIVNLIDENELKKAIELDRKATELIEENKKIEALLKTNASKLGDQFDSIFSVEFNRENLEDLSYLDFNDVKSRLKKIDDINEEIKIIDRNNRSIRGLDLKTKIFAFLILIIAGGVLLYLNNGIYYNYGAIAAIAASISGIIHAVIKDKEKITTRDELELEKNQLKDDFVSGTNLKFNMMVQEYMDMSLYDDLKAMKISADEYIYLYDEYNSRKTDITAIDRNLYYYFNEKYDYIERKIKLDNLYNNMEEQKDSIKEIKLLNRAIDRINDKLEILDKDINETENLIHNMENIILSLGSDIEEGFRAINTKKADRLRLENINKDLSNMDYLKEDLITYDEKYQNTNILDLKDNVENIIDKINEKKMMISNINKDIYFISESFDLEKISGELLFIEEEIKTEKLKYDRLLLLRYLINSEDEKYKEIHQPQIYKRAGDYLYKITKKYSELKVLDDKNLLVKYNNEYIKVDSSFSKGTLNQIYLSLRLSLIDFLDKEVLPICFDELLVNFDERRLDNTIDIINKIGENRQVFIFTCNKYFYDKLKGKKYLL